MTSTKKEMIKVKDRVENGIELRKTHFSLGTDSKIKFIKFKDNQFNSQYRNDFPSHTFNNNLSQNMDSVTLRKTHFKLGDHKNQYLTSTGDHNKEIEGSRARSVATLDPAVKADLRSSHFTLGNFQPEYNTIFRSEFYNKTDLKDKSTINMKTIEKQLRKQNYVLGNDVPDYKSETQAKFAMPIMTNFRNEKKISSSELQKSHCIFGTDQDAWQTTSQSSYFAKDIQNKKFIRDLTRTNFNFGQDNPDFKSSNQQTYVPHQYCKNNDLKDLSKDLRNHHFDFGNENGTESMTSINQQDYGNPLNSAYHLKKLDVNKLRASHIQLGDNCQAPSNQYETTYGITMKYRENPLDKQKANNNFKTSVTINGDGPLVYGTESRNNYGYKTNPISAQEIKVMKAVINDIRGHHFALGDIKNDYGTTTGATFHSFDPKAASSARGFLDAELKSDLRATHYQLGYMPNNLQTTHQSNYVPMPVQKHVVHDPKLRKSHIDINPGNRNVFDSKTIYMMDFNKKQTVD